MISTSPDYEAPCENRCPDLGSVILTFGHCPFPRSLNQTVSVIDLTHAGIYAHTNTRAKWLDTPTKD